MGNLAAILEETLTLLQKHGVTTYHVMMIDPDSHAAVFQYSGNEAEIFLQAEMAKAEILKSRLEA